MGRINEEKRKKKIEEQIGKTYGYYTILSFAEFRGNAMFFNCRCVCGNEKVVKLAYLKNGHTISCGCNKEGLQAVEENYKEQFSGTDVGIAFHNLNMMRKLNK